MLDSFALYQYHLQLKGKHATLLIIKNCMLMFSIFLCGIISRARLVDLRSKVTLKILKAHSSELVRALNPNKNYNLLDKIIEFTDYNVSLSKMIMPDDFKWIEVPHILHYVVRGSFIFSENFTINVNDLESICICNILKKVCTCTHNPTNNYPDINFCNHYWPARVFLEFSSNCLEEYFTKIYLMHLNKLHFNHEFLPVDVVLSPNLISTPLISKQNLETFSAKDTYLSQYKSHPFYTSFFVSALQIKSNIIDGSGITKSSSEDIKNYRESLPLAKINSLSIESSYEEAQIWLKLGIQIAYYSQDISAIIHTTSTLVRNYFYIGKEYVAGEIELEKLIFFLYNSLAILTRSSVNLALRKFIQATIIREKSALIQYKKHKLVGLQTPFYPAQLMTITISMHGLY